MGNTKKPDNSANLAFFKTFLNSSVISYPELAKQIGISATAIHHWFRCDDVRISQIEACAAALGYELYISISDAPTDVVQVDDFGVRSDGVKVALKRLHFLTCAIKEQKLTKAELASRIGITRDAISYWYSKDDMTVTNAISCAKALERNLNFKFFRVRKEQTLERKKIYIRSSIFTSDSWEVSAK